MPDRRTDPKWTELDAFFTEALNATEAALVCHAEAARATARDAGLPDIHVSPAIGKHLHLLARAIGATRVLEIGTLAGYSTIWLAGALPPDGRVTTLEIDPKHAELAGANLRHASLADRVEILVAPALESLVCLVRQRESGGRDPFDLVFIDADKENIPAYVAHALALTRPGSLILVDNVLRQGRVIDETCTDADVLAVRTLLDSLSRDPRLSASVLQIVGTKGHDGLLMALVN